MRPVETRPKVPMLLRDFLTFSSVMARLILARFLASDIIKAFFYPRVVLFVGEYASFSFVN